jgi:MFS family permease
MITSAGPLERHGRLLASLSLAYGVSFLVGVVGTPAVLSASWRWVYVGEGLAAAAALAMSRAAGEARPSEPRWDFPGLITWALSLSCLALGINRIQGGPAAGGWVPLLTGLGIGLAAAFVVLERRPAAAVFPLSIFLHGEMRILLLLCLGTGLGQVVLVQVPSVAGARLGVSPAGSGWLMLPLVAGGLIASALTTLWLDRLGPRTVLIAGAVAALAGILIESALPPTWGLFLGAAALLGLGVSALSGGPLRYVAARAAAAGEQATAQAAVATLTNVGALFGSVLVGALAGSSSDERVAWERAMLVAAALMTATLTPALALRRPS